MSRKSRSPSTEAGEPLVCPFCARRYGLAERFCAQCGMPLVYSGPASAEEPVDERRERARKIRPEFTRGELVRVAGGRHQAEAELIQGLLIEEGVPSVLRRTRGFDVPDMLAAGPRDVLVPASGAEAARELLGTASPGESPERHPAKSRRHAAVLLAAIAGGALAATLLAWALMELGAG